MADLIVFGFKDEFTADVVLGRLQAMQKEYLVDLADAVVAVCNAEGKVNLKQTVHLVSGGAVSGGISGSFWGTLVGLLFLNPLAGFAVGGLAGAGFGALAGALSDYGIDDNFMKSFSATMGPSTSGLFILVQKAQPEKVIDELTKMNIPDMKVLKTSLSPEQEEKLRGALEKAL